MQPKFILMLTYNDKTVDNAIEIFEECKNLPVKYWGFKDVGLSVDKIKKLVKKMKEANKITSLEVVTYTEEECLKAAKLAVECEFDYLMGTVYYQSVLDYLKDKPIKYSPFCGKVSGSPSVLEGSIIEIIDEAKTLVKKGVDAFDLLAYRYVDDSEELAEKFIKEIKVPVILAGSINSYERLDKVKELNPWGFTMGSALFDNKFVPEGNFKDQVNAVVDYLKEGK